MPSLSRRTVVALSAAALMGGLSSASAQSNYPSRPITLIVPLQAGTASDLVARVVAQNFTARTGKNIVIENVTGGGGGIGAGRVARAEPDGYTHRRLQQRHSHHPAVHRHEARLRSVRPISCR